MGVASHVCSSCHTPVSDDANFCPICGVPTPSHLGQVSGPGFVPALTAALAERYRIERPLGAGGMGTVFLAHDLKHDRDVAVKVLRSDVAEVLGRGRFLREIELAARLNHPHILPLYDSGESRGFLYFVMPVMQGQTLRDRLRQEKLLPVEDALRIAVEVADALDYAHRQGIVHRDIKPENVLLHEGHAVVADFGIGKALVAPGDGTATFTQAGAAVGTPAYMSPEQATGGDVDGRSDLFALGCVLYEMLIGEMPFTGPTVQAMIASRLVDTPPDVRERRPAVSDAVSAVVARLLAKSPGDRHNNGAEVVESLRSLETPVVSPASPDKSLAVLPFANLSADPENEYFADGLTEELITQLAQVRALRVISRTSSMQLKGSTKRLPEIGRELGVRYAPVGGVRKAGKALRITAQMVDTPPDTRIWGEQYAGTMDDVFELQERVSRAIVAALDVTLSREEAVRLTQHPIRSGSAFELYLRARQELQRYQADRAQALIDEAIAVEGPVPALRALGAAVKFVRAKLGMNADLRPLDEAEAEGRALVQAAPGVHFGYALLGLVAFERGNLQDAVRNLRAALERDATDADVHFFLGIALLLAGQNEAAAEASRRFLAADPLSPHAPHLAGIATWFCGRAAEGLDVMVRSDEMDPDSILQRWAVGYHYALIGRPADAALYAEFMRQQAPQMPYTVQLRSLLAALQGRKAEAHEMLAAVDTAALDGHARFHLAESCAMAGDTARALALAEDAVNGNFYPYDFIARHDPFMEPLRKAPEFARILATAKRRVEEFRA